MEKRSRREPDSRMHIQKSRLVLAGALAAAVVCIAAAAIYILTGKASFSGNNPQKDDGSMESDLMLLSSEPYDSVLLSMHSTQTFSEEDFAYCIGGKTVITSHAVLDTRELAVYLDAVLGSGNEISCIYLCLDPELLWVHANQDPRTWESLLERDLYSYIAAYPHISFQILLPSPYIDYWLELGEKKFDTLLDVYHDLVVNMGAYSNVTTFFPGYEYWLMVNPLNFSGSMFDTNEVITQKLFLYTFCDGAYQITPANEDFFWNSLRETIQREKNTPTVYPDLSDRCLVFFGDSVLALSPGSFSIPGYIQGLSGAAVYNYAVGGTSAANSFPIAADVFFGDAAGNEELKKDIESKKLCFIINYGFNDYFSGISIDNPLDPQDTGTYKGSLRACISRLSSSFPDASLYLMTPTHTSLFDSGRMVTEPEGDIFPEYIKAAEDVSEEMGLFFIDNYNDFIITSENLDEYLGDGVHPNEKGRLTIAVRIMEFLSGSQAHTPAK